ncbi:serine hydrolase [Nostoc sp. NIES-2111]
MTRREMWGAVAAALQDGRLEQADAMLRKAAAEKMPRAASFYYSEGKTAVSKSYGEARQDSKFLVASISKPMAVAGVLWVAERKKIDLGDPVERYLPEFVGGERPQVQVRHLLTHTSGLPDMLPENTALRQRNAPLSEFVRLGLRTPLLFAPGSRWSYSSTGILLACEIAQRVDGRPIAQLLAEEIFRPLGMQNTVLGLGRFRVADMVRSQTEHAPADLGGAAGAGACLITDAWEGIEQFLKPDEGVLVARDGADVAAILESLTPERAGAIGGQALSRVMAEHTYSRRAQQVEDILRETFARKRERSAA